jgi:hypothetical protein
MSQIHSPDTKMNGKQMENRNLKRITKITYPAFVLLALACFAVSPTAQGKPPLPPASNPKFVYTDGFGRKQSVEVIDKYYPKKIDQPVAKLDPQIDPKLRRAATIAEERARAHSLSKCWCFVKEALVAADVVKSRPQTPLAKQAGQELVNNYGFKKLPVSNPYEAPVGSVLVYGAKCAPGHVEIRTETGFVSDFRSKTPSRRPLIGVFAKS